MGLPILDNQEQRPVPIHILKERLKKNIKSPRTEGLSSSGKPSWLKIRPPSTKYHDLRNRLSDQGLVTVCQESHCPNMSECWSGGTATFMVLGDTCTRACKFCAVQARGKPDPVDEDEPNKLVTAVEEMNLEYVVLTSVDRDDLPDGGATHFANCIKKLKEHFPELLVEVLIPDFQGNKEQLQIVLDAKPDVLAHNIETIRRLQNTVRDRRAGYEQSIEVLRRAKKLFPGVKTKTSIMLGLGESMEEVHASMDDLRKAEVDIITFGQYLRPSSWHLPVDRYVPPEEFKALETTARTKGFMYCASGPFIRSSYRAGELYIKGILRGEE